jgi:hypothetical protein
MRAFTVVLFTLALAVAGCSSGGSTSASTTTSSARASASTSSTAARPTSSTATTGVAVGADLHSVDWRNTSVPASVCGGRGSIQLHNGSAVISSSRFVDSWQGPTPSVVPSQVQISATGTPTYGDIDGDGHAEAVVPVWCDNGGGTADGQLAEALVVFRSTPSGPAVLAIVTTTQTGTGHVSSFDSSQIGPRTLTAIEAFYGPNDPTCCPTGRAETVWTYNGTTLVPGTPKVTQTPS